MPSNHKALRKTNRNLRAEINALQAKLVQLQSELSKTHTMREKIDIISSEVIDSNPYSRLMALQRMGVVKNYAMWVHPDSSDHLATILLNSFQNVFELCWFPFLSWFYLVPVALITHGVTWKTGQPNKHFWTTCHSYKYRQTDKWSE